VTELVPEAVEPSLYGRALRVISPGERRGSLVLTLHDANARFQGQPFWAMQAHQHAQSQPRPSSTAHSRHISMSWHMAKL